MVDIAVLGSGSWGTVLANHLAKKGIRTCIWSPFPEELTEINEQHRHSQYLPGLQLESSLLAQADLHTATDHADIILIAVPSRFFQETLEREPVRLATERGATIINASKGLSQTGGEPPGWAFASEAFESVFGHKKNYINITGPTFAKELAKERYSALLVSGIDHQRVDLVQDLIRSSYLRTSPGNDVIGAEVGGVLKNGYAVLAGACAGLGYGANTYSAVLTACLEEMRVFGVSQGAQASTFLGLSGVGDLVLTTGSELSRNYRLGYLVAEGVSVADAQKKIGQETEGYHTAMAAEWMSQRLGRDLEILCSVRGVLCGELTAKQVVANIFAKNT